MFFVPFLLVITYGDGYSISSPLISKCAIFSLTISPSSETIVVNWSFNCTKERIKPDKFTFFIDQTPKFSKDVKDVIDKCSNKCNADTGVKWDYQVLPGGWYTKQNHPLRDPLVCYRYYLKLYKNNTELESQCIHAHVNWMSRFKDNTHLRLGELFIPGTHRSLQYSAFQNIHIWQQLVFGMRYFDIDVGAIKIDKKDTFSKKSALNGELNSLRRFMELTYKEIVILDIHGFDKFQGESDHEKLINLIKDRVGPWMAIRRLGNHKKGPLLRSLWKTNMRLVVNYRDEKTVEKHNVLWNDIFIKDGNTSTREDLNKYLSDAINIPYKEKMSSIVAVVHSSNTNDRKKNALALNPFFVEWYSKKNVRNRINIFIIDFYESSRLHIDCFWMNGGKKLVEAISFG